MLLDGCRNSPKPAMQVQCPETILPSEQMMNQGDKGGSLAQFLLSVSHSQLYIRLVEPSMPPLLSSQAYLSSGKNLTQRTIMLLDGCRTHSNLPCRLPVVSYTVVSFIVFVSSFFAAALPMASLIRRRDQRAFFFGAGGGEGAHGLVGNRRPMVGNMDTSLGSALVLAWLSLVLLPRVSTRPFPVYIRLVSLRLD
ncbi:hypothetical protein U1Q18_051727 [Sarracenia purpurea var. burkii]